MEALTLYIPHILISIFAAVNIIAFIIVAYDKRKSVVGNSIQRTPEGKIFFLASIGAAAGVYAAMQLFRHKTRKWYFQLGIPLLILQNLAVVYVVWKVFV